MGKLSLHLPHQVFQGVDDLFRDPGVAQRGGSGGAALPAAAKVGGLVYLY